MWTGFQNSLFTLIYLPIKSSLYNIEQNSNMLILFIHYSSTEQQHDFIFLSTLVATLMASDILHLTIKNREAAASSLLNRILLNRNTLCNEMQCKLYEVSLHCLWFRLPVVDRFSKFTFYIDLFTN